MAHTSDIRESSIAGHTIVAKLRGAYDTTVARFAQYQVYRNTLRELETLSKRELNDLGLNQYTLRTVAHEAAYGKA